MKNLLESFAVFLVGALSLLLVFLIVQYNMIEEEVIEDSVPAVAVKAEKSKKTQTKSYLDSLEGYGGDVDVKVDATKETFVNTVAVTSELSSDELGQAVEDKEKSSYMENLANYQDQTENEAQEESVKKAMETVKPEVVEVREPGEPEKLPEEEIEDEIGIAIDAALDGL